MKTIIDKYKKIAGARDIRLLSIIDSTPCFAKLWKDETGICPEESCLVRKECQAAYEEHQCKTNPISTTIPQISAKKYQRVGYLFMNRPVDYYIKAIMEVLDFPPFLPSNWSYKVFDTKYTELGRLVVSQTASYHAFIVDGILVTRFWTNSANNALIDLYKTLIPYAAQEGFTQLEIKQGSVIKILPCTARIYCRSTEDAVKIGTWIKKCYKLEIIKE